MMKALPSDLDCTFGGIHTLLHDDCAIGTMMITTLYRYSILIYSVLACNFPISPMLPEY